MLSEVVGTGSAEQIGSWLHGLQKRLVEKSGKVESSQLVASHDELASNASCTVCASTRTNS